MGKDFNENSSKPNIDETAVLPKPDQDPVIDVYNCLFNDPLNTFFSIDVPYRLWTHGHKEKPNKLWFTKGNRSQIDDFPLQLLEHYKPDIHQILGCLWYKTPY